MSLLPSLAVRARHKTRIRSGKLTLLLWVFIRRLFYVPILGDLHLYIRERIFNIAFLYNILIIITLLIQRNTV